MFSWADLGLEQVLESTAVWSFGFEVEAEIVCHEAHELHLTRAHGEKLGIEAHEQVCAEREGLVGVNVI
jgi:hypothetical protein